MDKETLQSNLIKVKTQITEACKKAGIDASNVSLLAVSKTHPSEMIQWAFEKGQVDFGENYVQEAITKQKELNQIPIHWHFIGQLQKNKVKNVVGAFDLIHSVDSFELAQKISQKSLELGLQQKILLEINLGDETTKGGLSKALVKQLFPEILALPNLELAGLMALPPLHDDPEQTRPFFRDLKQLFGALKQQLPEPRKKPWQFLSMGTTHDFAVAIEEGANIVRVGTAIFGAREAKQPKS